MQPQGHGSVSLVIKYCTLAGREFIDHKYDLCDHFKTTINNNKKKQTKSRASKSMTMTLDFNSLSLFSSWHVKKGGGDLLLPNFLL